MWSCSCGTEFEERQQFGKVDEPLCLSPFQYGELLASVLTVEQAMETVIDTVGQLEEAEIFGDFDLESVLRQGATSIGWLYRSGPTFSILWDWGASLLGIEFTPIAMTQSPPAFSHKVE